MKILSYLSVISLVFSGCSSSNQNSWREISQSEFDRKTIDNRIHGYVDVDTYLLRGSNLGELPMRITFTMISWNKQSDSLRISGTVVDAQTGEYLVGVSVAFGKPDTLGTKCTILPTARTLTDPMGQFHLAIKFTQRSVLGFTLIGYLANIFDVSRVLK